MADRNRKRTTVLVDLPAELIALLVSKLNRPDQRSALLVSKAFLNAITTLTLWRTRATQDILKILTKFKSLNHIILSCPRIDTALIAISKSGLKIESLKIPNLPIYPRSKTMVSLRRNKIRNVRCLQVNWFVSERTRSISNLVRPSSLIAEFVKVFESVVELDFSLSEMWNDAGVEMISTLPNLRRINLDLNEALTDRSLVVLAENCVNLGALSMKGCHRLTTEGVCGYLRTCHNLRSVDFPSVFMKPEILELAANRLQRF